MSTSLKETILSSLADSAKVLDSFISNSSNIEQIERMVSDLVACFQQGNKVLICGNGGSACDALHFAEECTGRFRGDRAALPVIPLLEAGHITCVSNDYGFEHIFSRGIEAYGRPGDLLIAISTSGSSKNVIRAVEVARKNSMKVHIFLGKDGGKLLGIGDEQIWVHSSNTERIQEVHMMVLHILIESVERRMFPENYAK